MAHAIPAPSSARAVSPPPSHPRHYAPYPAPASYGERLSSTIPPEELYKYLDVAPFVRLNFSTEKRLNSYRQNLYKLNADGKFRFATRRAGWSSLIILRLK